MPFEKFWNLKDLQAMQNLSEKRKLNTVQVVYIPLHLCFSYTALKSFALFSFETFSICRVLQCCPANATVKGALLKRDRLLEKQ